MNSQILIKINHFVKNRLIETSGILIILLAIFLFLSIVTYSPNDPNFIYTPENVEVANIGGFYGSVISDFLLQSIGLISILLVLNLLFWGIKIILHKKIDNFISKIFYVLTYIIFGTTYLNISYNNSFWLIDNGNGGFVGRIIKETIYNFTNLIENEYAVYGLAIFTIIFFFLSSNIKINETIKSLIFPFVVIKKIFNLLRKNTKNNIGSHNLDDGLETKNPIENIEKEKQPILPFAIKKETKISPSNFKLPTINFLEKNPDLKKGRNITNFESNKNSQFLEKILLDFGVEGKIKRVSYGPVVT